MKLLCKIFAKVAGALFLLVSTETFAAMALAFSHTAPTNNNHAIVTGQATEAAAKQLALSECKRLTGKNDCEVVLSSSKPGHGAMYAACVSSSECFYSLATGYSSNRSAHDQVLAACKRDYGVDSCFPWGDWHEPGKTASSTENRIQASAASPQLQSSPAASSASSEANKRADSTAKNSPSPRLRTETERDTRELEQVCKGNGAVCTGVGKAYYVGRNGLTQDKTVALRYYEVGCRLGDQEGCFAASLEYLLSKEDETKIKGINLLKSTCSKGHQDACQQLKKLEGTSTASTAAGKSADSAAKTSPAPRGGNLKQPKGGPADEKNKQIAGMGMALISGPPGIRDVKGGLDLLKTGCAEQMPEACIALGNVFGDGINVAKDIDKSYFYYEKACFAGEWKSCEMVAVGYYLDGKIRKESPEKALPLLEHGCNLGGRSGCSIAANFYSNGKGVKQDKQSGANFYDKACSLGGAQDCFRLGYLYENGDGVPRDFARAARLYDKSCSLNWAQGCASLSIALLEGRGVEENRQKAFELMNKACTQGYAQACAILKR